MERIDFDFISLALATVGLFFICCATLHKKPRLILEEAFGIYRGGLRDLKSSVFKRNQVVMGFVCVVVAIVVNLVGSSAAREGGFMDRFSTPVQVVILLAGMAVLGGILNYLSRLWSKRAFKRLVFEVVTEYQWPFEDNMVLTREIGKLLEIPQRDDDTIESYVARIRSHLKIPHPLAQGKPRAGRAQRLG